MVKPPRRLHLVRIEFLYSQEISNGKTLVTIGARSGVFLYSQEISNGKTLREEIKVLKGFLYSQEISNGKTR